MRRVTHVLLCGGLLLATAQMFGCDGGEGSPSSTSASVGVDEKAPARATENASSGEDEASTNLPFEHVPLDALAPPSDYATAVRGDRASLGSVDVAPDPEAMSRNLRRMTIPQMRDAIRSATGGLYWSDSNGNDILEGLEPSLGVPNYIDTTAEELEASLVFQKFLGDAARSVCSESIQNDLEMAVADRVMLRFVDPAVRWDGATAGEQADIDENLRHMNLRITGHYVEEGDDEALRRARWLFRSVTFATNDPAKGWRAVCVALMTSPEFYLY